MMGSGMLGLNMDRVVIRTNLGINILGTGKRISNLATGSFIPRMERNMKEIGIKGRRKAKDAIHSRIKMYMKESGIMM